MFGLGGILKSLLRKSMSTFSPLHSQQYGAKDMEAAFSNTLNPTRGDKIEMESSEFLGKVKTKIAKNLESSIWTLRCGNTLTESQASVQGF
jgi:hypothetical protein